MGAIVFLIGFLVLFCIVYPVYSLILAINLKKEGRIRSIRDFMRHI